MNNKNNKNNKKYKAFMTAMLLDVVVAENSSNYHEFVVISENIEDAVKDEKGFVIKCKDLNWTVINTNTDTEKWFLIETTTRGGNSEVFLVSASSADLAVKELQDHSASRLMNAESGVIENIIGLELLEREVMIK